MLQMMIKNANLSIIITSVATANLTDFFYKLKIKRVLKIIL